MSHPVIRPGAVAVVTGGAAGIGLAAAAAFARAGMRVVIADLGPDRLEAAVEILAAASPEGAEAVMAVEASVARPEDLIRLEAAVAGQFGGTDLLMNNAGIQPGSGVFSALEDWERVLSVNLWGVIHGTRAFVPGMLARSRETGQPGLIINTGSKQGITTPPGDPAYNVAKAGVKVFTEALAHELRSAEGAAVSAHLLIPGFVFTELTAQGRTEIPDAAWTPEETVAFMLNSLEKGDFYILCPDNDVPRSLDERRIAWAAGDIIENRPALSRWHPAFSDAFAAFVRGED